MGYYTKFTLRTEPKTEFDLDELSEMSDGYGWEELGQCVYGIDDCVKWYDHTKHLRKFTKKIKNKNILFILEGEGEESGDIWREYHRNGKSIHYQAILTFPEFKEEDLE